MLYALGSREVKALTIAHVLEVFEAPRADENHDHADK